MGTRRSIPGTSALLVAGFVAGLTASDSHAKVFLDRERSLELAFGEHARVERKAHFLSEAQLARAREIAGEAVDIPSALVTAYAGWSAEGAPLGTAYFDSHRVRTLPETLMVVVSPEGAVSRVEILSFTEPGEYKPREAWLRQFRDKRLDRELALRRGVHGITGATLSAEAVTEAVRRTLALHAAIHEKGATP